MALKINEEFIPLASLEMLIKIYANQRALALYLVDKLSKDEDDHILDSEDFDEDVRRIAKDESQRLSQEYGDDRYLRNV